MSRFKAFITENAKALYIPAILVVVGILDSQGVELGVEVEHYVAALVTDALIWATPNRKSLPKTREQRDESLHLQDPPPPSDPPIV